MLRRVAARWWRGRAGGRAARALRRGRARRTTTATPRRSPRSGVPAFACTPDLFPEPDGGGHRAPRHGRLGSARRESVQFAADASAHSTPQPRRQLGPRAAPRPHTGPVQRAPEPAPMRRFLLSTKVSDDWYVGFHRGLAAEFWRAAGAAMADDGGPSRGGAAARRRP